MKTSSLMTLLTGMTLPLLTFAQAGDSPIGECGALLPEGSHYSIRVDVNWNRSTEPMTGGMSISLTDESTGSRPETIPPEAARFVRCVQKALGVPEGEA